MKSKLLYTILVISCTKEDKLLIKSNEEALKDKHNIAKLKEEEYVRKLEEDVRKLEEYFRKLEEYFRKLENKEKIIECSEETQAILLGEIQTTIDKMNEEIPRIQEKMEEINGRESNQILCSSLLSEEEINRIKELEKIENDLIKTIKITIDNMVNIDYEIKFNNIARLEEAKRIKSEDRIKEIDEKIEEYTKKLEEKKQIIESLKEKKEEEIKLDEMNKEILKIQEEINKRKNSQVLRFTLLSTEERNKVTKLEEKQKELIQIMLNIIAFKKENL